MASKSPKNDDQGGIPVQVGTTAKDVWSEGVPVAVESADAPETSSGAQSGRKAAKKESD